jgi:hypothetical protein
MEEISHLKSLYIGRRERMELRNFPPPVAQQFVLRAAAESGLQADNRDEVLDKVAELSQGNPAAILRMIAMAGEPRYRSGERVRLGILGVDFTMWR